MVRPFPPPLPLFFAHKSKCIRAISLKVGTGKGVVLLPVNIGRGIAGILKERVTACRGFWRNAKGLWKTSSGKNDYSLGKHFQKNDCSKCVFNNERGLPMPISGGQVSGAHMLSAEYFFA